MTSTSMSQKQISRAARIIRTQVPWDMALSALQRFEWFTINGGKRPNVHAIDGSIVCPVDPAIVSALDNVVFDAMGEEFGYFAWSPRQHLRARRDEKQAWIRASHMPRQTIKLPEIAIDEIVEELAETDQGAIALAKRMKGGYTTVLLLATGDRKIRQAQAFRVMLGRAMPVPNPVKHRDLQSLTSSGWKIASPEKFPEITISRAMHIVQRVEQRLSA